jgi:hypothetical protein
MMQKIKNPTAGEAVETTINGRLALQEEISGTQEGTNIVFLHTTIEAEKSFHQILAWTSKTRWEQQKDRLQEVTKSFRDGK